MVLSQGILYMPPVTAAFCRPGCATAMQHQLPLWVKMRYPQNEDMFSGLHPIADITGSSADKIVSAADRCDGGPMSAFWARFGRIESWLSYLLAFAFGLALGGTIIASFSTAPGSSGLRYVQSGVRSDRPRFAFATKIVVQTDKVVAAPFEVTVTCDGEIGDADWDLIGYRERNSAGPSAQPAEPAGNTFTVRILSPDFLPKYTVAAVLYSKTSLSIEWVDVNPLK